MILACVNTISIISTPLGILNIADMVLVSCINVYHHTVLLACMLFLFGKSVFSALVGTQNVFTCSFPSVIAYKCRTKVKNTISVIRK